MSDSEPIQEKLMKTYFVDLECTFPDEHRANEMSMQVTLAAESPDQIEEPLRKLIADAQAEEGFNEVFVNSVRQVPTEPSMMRSCTYGEDTRSENSDVEELRPSWIEKLETPDTPEVHARHHELLVKLATERGDKPPAWEESLGHTVAPFMKFADAVKPEHRKEDAQEPNAVPVGSSADSAKTVDDDSSGYLVVERAARESGLHLVRREEVWHSGIDWPHIDQFTYDIMCRGEDDEDIATVRLGTVDGYRIRHDLTFDSDHEIWDEADALDGDVLRYTGALVRELRAFDEVGGVGVDLTDFEHITIIRHVQLELSHDVPQMWRDVAACLAMIDVPAVMLVDPQPINAKDLPKGKLKTCDRIEALTKLGFVRMVGSPFVWGWNRRMSECLMSEYSYSVLSHAAKEGKLSEILKADMFEEVYGPMAEQSES